MCNPDENFPDGRRRAASSLTGMIGKPYQAVVTVRDSDPSAPRVSLADMTVPRTVGLATVRTTLSRAYRLAPNFGYRTNDGVRACAAIASTHYAPTTNAMLPFAVNSTTTTVQVPIVNNATNALPLVFHLPVFGGNPT